MAGLGGKELRERDEQIGPVNPFPPRADSLLTNKITKEVSFSPSRRELGLRKRDEQIGPVNPFLPRGSSFISKIVWR